MASRLLFLPLVVATAGCQRYPEDPIFAYGELQHADGSPRPEVTLTVERTEAPLNPGLDDPPPSFLPYTSVTTDAVGRFTAEMLVGDARYFESSAGQFKPRFRVAAPLEQGRGVWLSFGLYDDVELPALRPWSADLAPAVSAGGQALAFASPPPAPTVPPGGDVPTLIRQDGTEEPLVPPDPVPVVQLHSGGELLWQQTGPASPWMPTPWVLEDFGGLEAQVRAMTAGAWSFSPLGASGGTVEFRLEWRSERIPWPSGALRPVSRGAGCLPATASACPWTDGKLAPVLMETLSEESVDTAGVSLTAPTRLSRAVIRGLLATPVARFTAKDRVAIEGSEDGAQWTRLATVAPFRDEGFSIYYGQEERWNADSPFDAPLRTEQRFLFLDVPLVDAPPVSHVRVFILQQEEDGRGEGRERRAYLRQLAELSLFE